MKLGDYVAGESNTNPGVWHWGVVTDRVGDEASIMVQYPEPCKKVCKVSSLRPLPEKYLSDATQLFIQKQRDRLMVTALTEGALA